VAGLQTVGKTYLATSENIARFTNGRFAPKGLATVATIPTEMPVCAAQPLPKVAYFDAQTPAFLLVTPEDLHPESLLGASAKINGAGMLFDPETLGGDNARAFVAGAVHDAAERVGKNFKCPAHVLNNLDGASLIAQARETGAKQIITAYAPVGPVADALARIAPSLASAGIPLVHIRRAWDERFWPHATKGFFPFKERIPKILQDMGI
jgi:deoxyribodipyrimidine photo-lyase